MPTILEGGPEYNKLIFNYDRSWTDDLPVCKVSGMYKMNIILFSKTPYIIIIIQVYFRCRIPDSSKI